MAAPALRPAAWMGVVALAAGAIIALAWFGHRPDPSMARFEAAGVMLTVQPDAVTEVVLSQGERRWRFERASARTWTAAPGPPPAESASSRIESGLRFLHVSAPQRVLQPEEVAGIPPSEFGLEPPHFSVSVRSRGAAPFNIEFGARNPQGLAQYARLTGRAEILLLPGFIGEQWESVMTAR